MNHQTSTVPQVIPQVAYQSPQDPIQLMTKSPFVDLGFAVLVFSLGDDPIACLNKEMAFLTAIASSRFLSTNNLTLELPLDHRRNQAIFLDGRVTAANKGRILKGGTGNEWESQCCRSSGSWTILVEGTQLEFLADLGNFKQVKLRQSFLTMLPSRLRILILMILIVRYSTDTKQDFEQSPVIDFTNNEISCRLAIVIQILNDLQRNTKELSIHDKVFCDNIITKTIYANNQMGKKIVKMLRVSQHPSATTILLQEGSSFEILEWLPLRFVQIVLWYLNSGCSKHMTGNHSQLMNFVSKFLGALRFRNDQIVRIMGYGDYQPGNIIISRVYYVEGLGHNLFSVGQFCDADLEVEFWKNTCFIQNLEGVDLLLGSRYTNLYTISLDDMLKSSSICLLSKASKTKS
ncbi:hypothetical protein Tco_0127550 [Tanacetum coccineum]